MFDRGCLVDFGSLISHLDVCANAVDFYDALCSPQNISLSTTIARWVTVFLVMKPFRSRTAIEQLAEHLRGEIQAGALGETLPGVHRLAKELGVSPKSVVAAVSQLEHEGLLRGQGAGRRCRVLPSKGNAPAGLRIRILLYEKASRSASHIVDLHHRLTDAGHQPEFAAKDLHQLGMDPGKVARFVKANPADGWVVGSGSLGVLEWFADQPLPVFAFFGRHIDLPIAGVGVQKIPAMLTAVRRLVALGHRRIVMLVREERRKPQPGWMEQTFLDELGRQGIQAGSYHLPDWKDSRVGFHRCLDSLFQHTPPTALIISETLLFAAAQQHLARRGIVVPEHVSLICDDPDPLFAWFEPAISCIHWDPAPLVRSAVRWANLLACGKRSHAKTFYEAKFVEGGMIGPVKH
jgi:DNA-binding Lrp family transcriptional regulator